jgi:pimeloyl-ACP methyl ester carboxylesterase
MAQPARFQRCLFALILAMGSAGLAAHSPHQGVAPSFQELNEPISGIEAGPRLEPTPKAESATRSSPVIKSTPPAKRPGPVNIKQVKFTTEDHLVIAAGFVPPLTKKDTKAPIVVLLHMYKSDRSAYTPLIGPLHGAGFAVLAIDLRGHGDSVGPPDMKLIDRVAQRDRDLFKQMRKDVDAAYQWLREQREVDLTRFVIVGASVGCSVALDYASRDQSVDGIVCMTPGTLYLGLDSLSHVAKYGQRPLLLLASEPERSASDQLAQAARQATVKVFPDQPALGPMGLHGTRMFGKAAGIEKLIVDFLIASAGQPSDSPVVASIRGQVYYDPDSSYARKLSPKNLRWFSSPAEAEARGFRPPKSRTRSKTKSTNSNRRTDPTAEPFPDGN